MGLGFLNPFDDDFLGGVFGGGIDDLITGGLIDTIFQIPGLSWTEKGLGSLAEGDIMGFLDPGNILGLETTEDAYLAAQNAAMESQLAIARDQYERWQKDYKPYEEGLADQATHPAKQTFDEILAPLLGAPKDQALRGLMTPQRFPHVGLPKQTQGVGLRAAGDVANRGITAARNQQILNQPGRIESVLSPILGLQSSAAGTIGSAGQVAGGLGQAELQKQAFEAEQAGQTAYGLTNYLAGRPWRKQSVGLGASPYDQYMGFGGNTVGPSLYYNGIPGSSEYDQFY